MAILQNGDFESTSNTHDVNRWLPGATEPDHTYYDNIVVPRRWVAWWREEFPGLGDPDDPKHATGRPEGKIIGLVPDQKRVRSGVQSVCLFTFWRNHDCGYQQPVAVTPGARYQFSIFAHSWHSECDAKPYDPPLDKDCKTVLGDSHDWISVGIDPDGGIDPFAAGVVWSAPGESYGTWKEFSVEATAAGPQITVFTRAQTIWPLKHCDTYYDDAKVIEVAPPEPPEPPEECRGTPRTQYRRVFNVIPATASDERAAEIFMEGWKRGHETAGGSYDDAGVGDLDERIVRLYDVPEREKSIYQAFYDEWYPGTQVSFAGGEPEPPVPPVELVLTYPTTYVPPTITQHFSSTHKGLDLRSSWAQWQSEAVCALDGTVVEAGWVYDTLGNNVVVHTVMRDGRQVDCRYAHLLSDVYVRVGDTVEAGQKLGKCNGTANPPVADHLHFSVNVDGTYVDPEPLIDWPEEPEPPEPPVTFNPRVLTLHLQQDVEAGQRYVSTCKPAGIKRVTGAQNLPTYAVLNPGMRCVYRGQDENDDPITFVNMHLDTLHQVADMFQSHGLPLIDGHYFWWELWNEKWGYERGGNLVWRDREIAAIDYLAQKEPRVGAVGFNAGVGNIQVANFDLLVPLMQKLRDNNGMAGLHSYFGATLTSCTLDNYESQGKWLEYRFEMTDQYLVEHGVKVNWFLSEGGAIYYQPPTNMPWSDAGWKHKECMNGDWARYLAYLEKMDQHFYEWNVMHDGRLKGYAIFTQGGGSKWQYFELGSAELDALAAMQIRKWPIA